MLSEELENLFNLFINVFEEIVKYLSLFREWYKICLMYKSMFSSVLQNLFNL